MSSKNLAEPRFPVMTQHPSMDASRGILSMPGWNPKSMYTLAFLNTSAICSWLIFTIGINAISGDDAMILFVNDNPFLGL